MHVRFGTLMNGQVQISMLLFDIPMYIRYSKNHIMSLLEILSFATCLMQLKNVACNCTCCMQFQNTCM